MPWEGRCLCDGRSSDDEVLGTRLLGRVGCHQAIEVAWTDTAAGPVRRPTRSGGCGRVERRCETWLTAPAPPDQTPYAVAEAVFADAKAYLSSREARQMSESELERELHRRGQELMRRLLQGHLDQRSPGKVAGPVEGADDVERLPQRVQERHPETTFGTVQVAPLGGVALVDGAQTQLDLASAAVYGVDATLW